MKPSALLFVFMTTFTALSQSTVSLDTSIINQEVDIRYTLETDLTNFTEVLIHQYSIDDGDTISLFYGSYNWEDDDPSEFSRFSIDEQSGVLTFNIGLYEPATFYGEVTITRPIGLPEEFIFN